MNKVYQVCATVLFCLVLLGPLMVFTLDRSPIELPSWANATDAAQLAGGKSKANLGGNLNIEGFLSGKMQSAAESKIGDSIPFKAMTMLGNSALQRASISLANVPFGWKAYHTYYGSSYLYLPDADAITYPPKKDSKKAREGWDAFAAAVCDYADAHPDKTISVIVPCGASYAAIHPAHDLIANVMTGQMAADYLGERLKGHSNVVFVTDGHDYTDPVAYFDYYYRTDHHWNIRGVASIMNSWERARGFTETDFGDMIQVDDFLFHGSMARLGLDMVEEEVFDSENTFAEVELVMEDGTVYAGDDHSPFMQDKERAAFDFYEAYYMDAPLYRAKGSGDALLITDSFGDGVSRSLATHFQNLHRVNAMAYDKKGKTIDVMTEGYDPQEIVFIATPDNYSTIMKRSPNLFGTAD